MVSKHNGDVVPMRPYWHLVLALVRPFMSVALGLEVRGAENVPECVRSLIPEIRGVGKLTDPERVADDDDRA